MGTGRVARRIAAAALVVAAVPPVATEDVGAQAAAARFVVDWDVRPMGNVHDLAVGPDGQVALAVGQWGLVGQQRREHVLGEDSFAVVHDAEGEVDRDLTEALETAGGPAISDAIDVAADGGLAVAGGPEVGRYAPDGTRLWLAQGTSAHPEDNEVAAVQALPDGGAVVVSSFSQLTFEATGTPVTLTGSGYYVARYGPAGVLLWVHRLPPARSLAVLPDGRVAVGGEYSGTAAFDDTGRPQATLSQPGRNGYVVTYDLVGNVDWAVALVGQDRSTVTEMVVTPGGALRVAGQHRNGLEVQPPAGSLDPPPAQPQLRRGWFVVGLGGDGGWRWTTELRGAPILDLVARADGGVTALATPVSRIGFGDVTSLPMEDPFLFGVTAFGVPSVLHHAPWREPSALGRDPVDGAYVVVSEDPRFEELPGYHLTRLRRSVPGGSPPGSPRTVRTVAGNGEVTVQWRAPSTNGGRPLLGYRLLRDGRLVARIAPDRRTFVDGPLTNGITYRYRVVAVNSRGSRTSAEAAGTPVGPRTGAPQVDWVRTIGGGNLTTVTAAPGGGLYAGGRRARLFGTDPLPIGVDRPDVQSVPGQSSGFVARFSATGGLTWLRAITGPSVEHVTAVESGAGGSVYATGRIEAPSTFTGGGRSVTVHGPALFVAHWSAAGELLWARAGPPQGYGTDLAVGDDGEITVVGVRDRDPNSGYLGDDDLDVYPDVLDEDGLVARFDAGGRLRWTRTGTSPDGGAAPTAVASLPDGGAVLAALHEGRVSWGTTTFGQAGFVGTHLLQLSGAGRVVRSTVAQGVVTMDLGRRSDGSYVVGGRYRGDPTLGAGPEALSLPPIEDELGGGFVAVLDAQFRGRWVHGFEGGRVRSVSPAPGGDVVATGAYRGEVTITGTNRSVDLQALLRSPSSTWDHDLYLARFRGDGRLRWATDLGGAGREAPTQVRVAPTGHLLVSGTCRDGWVRFGEPGRERDVGRTGTRRCGGAPPPFVESWVARFG